MALQGDLEAAVRKLQTLLESEPWKSSDIPIDWWKYMKATLFYLQGDLANLIKIEPRCEINKDLVLRFING